MATKGDLVKRCVSSLERLRRDETGAAMVEAVVMLPFFLLLFGLVLYVYREHEGRISASADARNCAWTYSANNCEGPLPPGCRTAGSIRSEEIQAADVADGSDSILGALSGIPFVGMVIDAVFGTSHRFAGARTFERPKVMGGGERTVSRNYTMMCNEVPRDTALEFALDMLEKVFDAAK